MPRRAREVVVTARPGDRTRGIVRLGHLALPCALGRGGIRALKREGDGATPAGCFRLRSARYRPDALPRPPTALPLRALRHDDGWCDAPCDANYNRPVRHPYPASAERMWRGDALYDLVVVVGHNDRPRVRGAGSAIFIHVARPGFAPTEGCVALRRPDLVRLLALLSPATRLRIRI